MPLEMTEVLDNERVSVTDFSEVGLEFTQNYISERIKGIQVRVEFSDGQLGYVPLVMLFGDPAALAAFWTQAKINDLAQFRATALAQMEITESDLYREYVRVNFDGTFDWVY